MKLRRVPLILVMEKEWSKDHEAKMVGCLWAEMYRDSQFVSFEERFSPH